MTAISDSLSRLQDNIDKLDAALMRLQQQHEEDQKKINELQDVISNTYQRIDDMLTRLHQPETK
ncbi:MAG: hypothetical protein ILP11_02645 [Alphaproteobacteria bacterium]|nr:hypothetical protein [Alphaproteobacteria bacterium]